MSTELETQLLSVPEAATARRSIRLYKPEPVPREDIERILDTVRLAPSAFNVQPWRFVVVTDPELKARLGVAANGQRQVTGAPAVIVLYTDMQDVLRNAEEIVHPGVPADRRDATIAGFRASWAAKSDAEREHWGAGQGNIALGYLLLAAASYGYATSAMLGFDPKKVKDALGLPAHVMIPAMVAIGRADEDGFTHHRHPLERIVSWR
ncbi:MAG TPA: nitroreductase family protein [Gemmatimonadaceae bacterium]|nr:nitroreductase family protein [Gemmatimonadaceae bacterium]